MKLDKKLYKLTKARRNYLADKLGITAPVALAALVFEVLAGDKFNIWLIILGVGLFLTLFGLGYILKVDDRY